MNFVSMAFVNQFMIKYCVPTVGQEHTPALTACKKYIFAVNATQVRNAKDYFV